MSINASLKSVMMTQKYEKNDTCQNEMQCNHDSATNEKWVPQLRNPLISVGINILK